jgi:hypothetical protein
MRVGATSNTHAGNDFEGAARDFFGKQGIVLTKNFSVLVGISEAKKPHRFDLGSESPPVLVECKSHTWTQGGNMPNAKTVWNEAMYYFHVAPDAYQKYFSSSSTPVGSRALRPLPQNARPSRAGRFRALGIRPRIVHRAPAVAASRGLLGPLPPRTFAVTALRDTLASGGEPRNDRTGTRLGFFRSRQNGRRSKNHQRAETGPR